MTENTRTATNLQHTTALSVVEAAETGDWPGTAYHDAILRAARFLVLQERETYTYLTQFASGSTIWDNPDTGLPIMVQTGGERWETPWEWLAWYINRPDTDAQALRKIIDSLASCLDAEDIEHALDDQMMASGFYDPAMEIVSD